MNVGFEDPLVSQSQVILYDAPYGKFACVGSANLGLYYSITSVNNIPGLEDVQRILLPAHFTNQCFQEGEIHSLEEKISWINKIRISIDAHVENIYKIAPRLGWQAIGKGLVCLSKFKHWILNDYQTDHSIVDLSGLGLSLLPPHIGIFSELERLDLSNNNIRILPVELQFLKKIQSIDIRNNPIVELPSWLIKMAHVEVKTDIIPEEQDGWAQGIPRVLQLPL